MTGGELMKKLALLKIADPEKGPSRQEYEDLCKSLGIEPKPERTPEAPPETPSKSPGAPEADG
jgi:hypothetical protein